MILPENEEYSVFSSGQGFNINFNLNSQKQAITDLVTQQANSLAISWSNDI